MKKERIIILLVCVLIAVFLLFWFQPKNSPEIHLQDQCGSISSLVSHTIADEDTCRVRCTNQCKATKRKLSDTKFVLGQQTCNDCYCTCRDKWWWE